MNSNRSVQLISIDGIWNKNEHSEYRVVLRADGWKETSYGQLRSLLFGWDASSWYGTDIEESKLNGRTILTLTPRQAFEFLTAPASLHLLEVAYSERLQLLRKVALQLLDCLEQGKYEPDAAMWNSERGNWRLELDSVRQGQWDQLMQQSQHYGFEGLHRWPGLLINELLECEPHIAACWLDVLHHAGQDMVMTTVSDEEEWLTAIGYKEDTLPYKLAVSLHEPAAKGASWMLRTSIYNKADEQWYTLVYERSNEVLSGHQLFAEKLNAGVDSFAEPVIINDSLRAEQASMSDSLGAEQANSNVSGNWHMERADGGKLAVPQQWAATLPAKLVREWHRYVQVLEHEPQIDEQYVLRQAMSEQEAWQFLEFSSQQLLAAGCKVILPAWWESVKSRRLKVKGKMRNTLGSPVEPMFGLQQIVQFDWRFALGDREISEQQFYELAASNRGLIKLDEQWVYLSAEDIARVKKWLRHVHRKKGLTFSDVLQMHLRGEHGDWFEDELEERLDTEIELNQYLAQWLAQLQNMNEIPLISPSELFLGELRPYQQQGTSWLLFLRRYGLGAVLADDMGLGKTIQYMAYLTAIKEDEQEAKLSPSLLICPTSVIGNWERELQRFAPHLQVVLHYGSKRAKQEQFAAAVEGADLVITSYALAQIDSEELGQLNWDSLCLDEAQNIKNAYTKQASAIRKLTAKHRVALTGTPMENRLTELWSIYDFINPGYLGSLYQFRRSMIIPIEREKDSEKIEALQRWVKPFMLRRIKRDPNISLSLPEKQETKCFIPLTAEQVSLYEGIVSDLLEKLDKEAPMQRRGLILGSLTKLKQLCDHPALLLGQQAKKQWAITRSSKLERLVEIVDHLAEQGERCLIFTQYVEMGMQIQQLLSQRYEVEVPYLHGAVPKQKRDEMIQSFQDESIPQVAFVLSLKAGGTGLNLTAANHVIHFDRWWNPAVENQATDRAFRIGQTRQVQVHKFITIGTLEEKIDGMIDGKQMLNDQIVQQSDQWITELSTEELKELFVLRNSWLKE